VIVVLLCLCCALVCLTVVSSSRTINSLSESLRKLKQVIADAKSKPVVPVPTESSKPVADNLVVTNLQMELKGVHWMVECVPM